jgi:uncharacterized damage-inducible protein DinB
MLTQMIQQGKAGGLRQSVLQILLHLVKHGTDHRAQTLAMLHTLGAETVDHNLIAFSRE